VSYAMTINKSQGQTLDFVGLYLKTPVFSHGQLYVVVSRVISRQSLKILIVNEDGTCGSQTKNVVYPEVFQSVSLART
jgi:replication factor A1